MGNTMADHMAPPPVVSPPLYELSPPGSVEMFPAGSLLSQECLLWTQPCAGHGRKNTEQ